MGIRKILIPKKIKSVLGTGATRQDTNIYAHIGSEILTGQKATQKQHNRVSDNRFPAEQTSAFPDINLSTDN